VPDFCLRPVVAPESPAKSAVRGRSRNAARFRSGPEPERPRALPPRPQEPAAVTFGPGPRNLAHSIRQTLGHHRYGTDQLQLPARVDRWKQSAYRRRIRGSTRSASELYDLVGVVETRSVRTRTRENERRRSRPAEPLLQYLDVRILLEGFDDTVACADSVDRDAVGGARLNGEIELHRAPAQQVSQLRK
jgi:hypothetical protein